MNGSLETLLQARMLTKAAATEYWQNLQAPSLLRTTAGI